MTVTDMDDMENITAEDQAILLAAIAGHREQQKQIMRERMQNLREYEISELEKDKKSC